MEAMARSVRGGVAGCSLSGLELEHCSSGRSSFGCCDSVFVGREPCAAGGLRAHCRSRNRVAARPVFSDRSHALFYARAGAGEERSTTADVGREQQQPQQQQQQLLTIAYGDEDDLLRQLAQVRSGLRRRGRKGKRREASSGSSSSSSSSSESSDSEEERERRGSRKEIARQRSRAARDVSVNALPVLDHRRVSPVRTVAPADAERAGIPSLSSVVDVTQSQQAELHTSAAELNRLFSLQEKDLGDAEIGPGQLTSAPVGTVKVCMGGKCKKMGAQTVLSAFQDSLAGNASVEAVPCKCLKKCGKAVNVTFGQGEEEPEMASQVEVDDVHDLLRAYFPQFSSAALSPSPSM